MRNALVVSLGALAIAGCFQARDDDFGIVPEIDAGPSCPSTPMRWPGWPEVQPPNFLVRANLPDGSLVARGAVPGSSVGTPVPDAGACVRVPTGYFVSAGLGDPPAPGAGRVTVSSAGGTAKLEPVDGGVRGVLYPYATLALAQRDTLSIEASGAEVPPFALQVGVPGYLDVTVPDAPTDGGAYTYDASRGIRLTWSGAACDDEAVVDLGLFGTDTGEILRCALPASEGGFVAPTWLLGASSARIDVTVALYRQTVVDAGAFTVVGETASQQFEGLFFAP